jgi:hypothetical protein
MTKRSPTREIDIKAREKYGRIAAVKSTYAPASTLAQAHRDNQQLTLCGAERGSDLLFWLWTSQHLFMIEAGRF